MPATAARQAPGERYPAEPDPDGWHEMVYVIEGTLRLELSGVPQSLVADDFVIYRSAPPYAYCNDGKARAGFSALPKFASMRIDR